MSDKEKDVFDDDLFTGFLDKVEPGATVPGIIGKLKYRAGSDPNDWDQAGSTKYLPGQWHMQVGSFRDMFTARSSGGFAVSFPEPFANPPIVFASVSGTLPAFEEVQIMTTIASASTFEVYWWSVNNLTRVYIHWLAFGPIGF